MRLLAVDNVMPEFGLYADNENEIVYAITLEKDGTQSIQVVGRIRDMTFEQARQAATELKSKIQLATPTPSSPRPPRRRRIHRQRSRIEELANSAPSGPSSPPAPINSPTSPYKLLSFAELKSKYNIPLSRRRIDQLETEENFPRRVPIGSFRVAWVAVEIEAFIEARMAKRSDRLGTLGSDTGVSRSRRKPPQGQ